MEQRKIPNKIEKYIFNSNSLENSINQRISELENQFNFNRIRQNNFIIPKNITNFETEVINAKWQDELGG